MKAITVYQIIATYANGYEIRNNTNFYGYVEMMEGKKEMQKRFPEAEVIAIITGWTNN